ncbi:hypothetical protein [Amycolatopsis sp. cmx-8-4]|uniref:hypothetical protein n=1 Tax=Amycolatopsis sp. cmx-8-4 TaxID=2790947 RepID=UPI00397C01CD
MRTFHALLADIDRELAAADTIPTIAPAHVALYLHALLTQHTAWITDNQGTVTEIVPADAIRRELEYLTQPSRHGSGEADKRPAIPCYVGCKHIDCDDRLF